MQQPPLAVLFAQLPNDLQRVIYKMATHNPFKPIGKIQLERNTSIVYEYRETPSQKGCNYTIQATWDVRKGGLRYLYVHQFTPTSVLCILSLNEDINRMNIQDRQLAPYLNDLVEAYRARKMV